MQARLEISSMDRFFLRYLNGKCIKQAIGINKFASIPKDIANYLQLPNADGFTEHSLRRTSATLLMDAGADLTQLQWHGGWKSATVAYGYIADSMNNKRKICDQISSGLQITKKANISKSVDKFSNMPSTSGIVTTHISKQNEKATSSRPVMISNILLNSTRQTPVYKSKDCAPTVTPKKNEEIHTVENINDENVNDNKRIHFTATNHIPEPKLTVFYHPDLGLCESNLNDENVNKTFVFHNCNVHIINNANGSCIFKSSAIADKAIQTEDKNIIE